MRSLDFNNIHKFSQNGLNILLDINSGSIHVIDEITWDFLDVLESVRGDWGQAEKQLALKYTQEEINTVRQELEELINSNLLFTPESDFAIYQPAKNPVVKALCLHVAHDCNLRCGYCFAGTGAFGGSRSLMTESIGKKSIDFLLKASQNRRHVEIDFFGGEPLLNFAVVKELVKYGQEQAQKLDKVIKFTLTTNGVLLNDEIMEFLNENKMSAVLSLDGRPEVNDRMRPFPGGQGSYALIKDKLLNFVESRNHEDYYVRGTYTGFNPDFAQDVKHLADLGFKEISVEPVVTEPTEAYALREEQLPYLKEQYEVLTDYYWQCHQEGRPFNFFHFNVDLTQGPCLPKRLSGCGAGHEYLAVSPEGDLYPCHQFMGKEEYKIGHVSEGIKNKELCRAFQNSHVLHKEECKNCWARFYCSGGCHANNLAYGGSLVKVYKLGCELQRKRLECAIYLQVRRALFPIG